MDEPGDQIIQSRRSPSLFTFFVLTYLLSWLVWIPLTLSHFGVGPIHVPEEVSNVVRLLGVLMPSIVAIVLIAYSGGRPALRGLWSRLKIWRAGWQWWVAAVLVYPTLLIIAGLLYNRLGEQPLLTVSRELSATAFVVNMILLALATLGEEIGWRGLALPGLQQRHSALVASVILGLLWASWHLPFWLLLDTFDQYGATYLVLNYLFVLPGTIYITWFFNHSHASLLLPIAFHLAFNIANATIVPSTTTIGAYVILIGLQWLVITAIYFHGRAELPLGLEGAV